MAIQALLLAVAIKSLGVGKQAALLHQIVMAQSQAASALILMLDLVLLVTQETTHQAQQLATG